MVNVSTSQSVDGDIETTAVTFAGGVFPEDGSVVVDSTTTNNDNDNSMAMNNNNDNNNNNGGGVRNRKYVSIYRKELQRIQTDSALNKPYTVPRSLNGGGGGTGSSFGAGGDSDGDSVGTNSRGGDRAAAHRYVMKTFAASYDDYTSRSWQQWLETFIPMTQWLKTYEWKSTFLKDVIAGVTVGVMIVPQSMSYAKLAGLPVVYGLYSAFTPVFAYSVFGSSRQLAVGPVALISLLMSTGLSHILERQHVTPATVGIERYEQIYAQMAIQTSFLVGVAYMILGVLRLGFVTIFLSHAVISGFTTGAAVIIGMSQVKYIFGYDVPRSDALHEVLHHIFDNIQHFNYRTFIVGSLSILTLISMKNVGKAYPKLKWVRAVGPLSVTAVMIIVTFIFKLENKGIPIVGPIPSGVPSLTVSEWTPINDFSSMFVPVISITIVGFMESIAIAKTLASKHKYEIDSSRELIGLGVANFVGGMFNSYPITGSFSRSAVNNESGAQSGISAMVTATIVLFVLLFLTPIFEKLPLAVLAGIVISGVLGLIDYDEAMYLWKVHKFDFGVWCIACAGTMFLGVEIGLAIAVVVSLLLVTYESAYPHTAVLGRLPGTTVYRNVKQYPGAEQYNGILMIRIDAPIYFANSQNVREKILKYFHRAEQLQREQQKRTEQQQDEENNNSNAKKPRQFQHQHSFDHYSAFADTSVKYIILELSPVSHIDTTALHIFSDMVKTYRNVRNVEICLSNPSLPLMERLVSSGLADEIGRDQIFTCIHDAVGWCMDQMDTLHLSIHDPIEVTEDVEQPKDVLKDDDGSTKDGSKDSSGDSA